MKRRRYVLVEARLEDLKDRTGVRRFLPEMHHMTREKQEVPGDRFSVIEWIRFKVDELFSIKVP
jgi:hypothetical protein